MVLALLSFMGCAHRIQGTKRTKREDPFNLEFLHGLHRAIELVGVFAILAKTLVS